MTSTKTILVDMDGVLANLLPTWLHEYGKASGEWLHVDDITKYDHAQFAADKDAFWTSLAPALEACPPVPGSAVFDDLHRKFERTFVVTYCHANAPGALDVKRAWLKRYFPEFNQKHIIATSEKYLCFGDVLIDDYVGNLEKWQEYHPRGRAMMFGTQYNREEDRHAWTWEEIGMALIPEKYNVR